jgi:hypothetical protein
MIAPIVSKLPHPIQRIGAKFMQICAITTQSQNSMIACKSWNSGTCSSPRNFVDFAIDAIETGAAARTAKYSAQNSR